MNGTGNASTGRIPRRGRGRRLAKRALLLLAACVAVVAVIRFRRGGGDDVLFVSVDTLRTDRIGCYGGTGRTGAMDRLAGSGILFERAATNIPRTTPAFATILTGRYPQHHGVRFLRQPLDPGEPVLPAVLQAAGFRTAAFVAGGPLEPATGLDRGFGTYRCYVDLKAGLVALRAIPWMVQNLTSRTFLWVHFFDPHFGYQPPWPWSAGTAPGQFTLYADIRDRKVSFGQLHFNPPLTETEHAWLRHLYTGEVSYTDAGISGLLAVVRVRDWIVGGHTLVILTADHGESLGEHGCWYEHGEYLYEPDVRIPLIVRWPGRLPAGVRSLAPAETIDIAPTVLDLLGLPPLPDADGRSLAGVLRGGEFTPRPIFVESGESFFPENRRRTLGGVEGKWRAVRLGDWKLVRLPRPDGSPALELYDVRTDPGESRDLAASDPSRAAGLEALLTEWMASAGHRTLVPPVLDDAARERLRSLGYLD